MLIDKDKTIQAIATYLFVNDAIRGPEPKKVRDYLVFAESMLKDVPETERIYCGGCTKWHPSAFPDTGACEKLHDFTDKVDWCAWAVRREP